MAYSIKQAAEIMNVTPSTLRFYDKQGLLPNISRRESGYRAFSEDDMAMLRLIACLKKTGMPIKDIQEYISLVALGDESLNERYEIILARKAEVEKQMKELQETLDFVNRKCKYYEEAIAAGTEAIYQRKYRKCDGKKDEE